MTKKRIGTAVILATLWWFWPEESPTPSVSQAVLTTPQGAAGLSWSPRPRGWVTSPSRPAPALPLEVDACSLSEDATFEGLADGLVKEAAFRRSLAATAQRWAFCNIPATLPEEDIEATVRTDGTIDLDLPEPRRGALQECLVDRPLEALPAKEVTLVLRVSKERAPHLKVIDVRTEGTTLWTLLARGRKVRDLADATRACEFLDAAKVATLAMSMHNAVLAIPDLQEARLVESLYRASLERTPERWKLRYYLAELLWTVHEYPTEVQDVENIEAARVEFAHVARDEDADPAIRKEAAYAVRLLDREWAELSGLPPPLEAANRISPDVLEGSQ